MITLMIKSLIERCYGLNQLLPSLSRYQLKPVIYWKSVQISFMIQFLYSYDLNWEIK